MLKRISRSPEKFDLMKIIDGYARSRGLNIHDQMNQEIFLADLGRQIESNRKNDILIHGLRIQTMFAYVAAALGVCRLIKEEDAGEFYSSDAEIRPPDFRIITIDGQQFFVEVKNCHSIDAEKGYRFTPAYLDSLKGYAEVFRNELYIAIYWSQLKLWTLLSPADFHLQNNEYVITLPEVMRRNNMRILGDCSIGTIPSLTLKLLSDPAKPRIINSSGHAEFSISEAELFCGDQLVDDPLEKQLVWFFMNYGNWPGRQLAAEVRNGELISLGFRVEPEERFNPGQQFEFVGVLSQMVSRQFNDITAPDGSVKLISPERQPDTFGVLIPPDYRRKALPLWRFLLSPS